MSLSEPPISPNLRESLQDLRVELVPTARQVVLEDLMREVDDYGEVTGNKAKKEGLDGKIIENQVCWETGLWV